MSHAVGVFGTPHRQIQGTPELHEQHEGKISRNNPYSFIRSNFLSIEVIGFLKPEKVEGGRKKSTYCMKIERLALVRIWAPPLSPRALSCPSPPSAHPPIYVHRRGAAAMKLPD